MHPSRRIAGLLATLLTSVLTFSLLPTTAPATAALPRAERAAVLLRLLSPGVVTISPDRRGPHHSAKIRYRLSKRARVTMRITPIGRPRHVFDVRRLGRQDRGRHTFTWPGTQRRVGRLPDGTYTVEIHARRPGRPSSAVRRAVEVTVDTREPGFSLRQNRATVHPRTTAFTDRVLLAIELEDSADDLDVTVRRFDGSLVRDLRTTVVPCDDAAYDAAACATTSWDGRTSTGAIASPGDYRLRYDLVDPVGNRSVTEDRVTVSATALVERTRTVTVVSSQFTRRSAICGANDGNGCGESNCGPATSQRFAGGLSFGACQSYVGPTLATAHFGALDSDYVGGLVGDTGHEHFQITAHGGTADGSTGSARMTAGSQQVTMTGDGAFALPAVPVTAEPLDVSFHPSWQVAALTADAWDVATFDITFTDFVPAS